MNETDAVKYCRQAKLQTLFRLLFIPPRISIPAPKITGTRKPPRKDLHLEH